MFNKSYPHTDLQDQISRMFHSLSKKIREIQTKNILEIGCNDGTFASNLIKKNYLY